MEDASKPLISTTSIPSFSEPTVTYSVGEQRKYWNKWAKSTLIGQVVFRPDLGEIKFTSTGIREVLNQPHDDLALKYSVFKDLINILKTATYLRSAEDEKGNVNIKFHYLETEVGGKKSYIVLKETKHNNTIALYSIVMRTKK